MSRVVGIDLGTSNCVIAVMEEGEPTVITTAEGRRIPSIVAFNKTGERLVGQAAKQQATLNAENTIFSVKRFLGQREADPHIPPARLRRSSPLKQDEHGELRFHAPYADHAYSPQEVAAILLNHLKKEAESYLGEPVSEAVITVPAYFDERRREAVRDAGIAAGLRVRQIINEPTAAALAYSVKRGAQRKEDETVLVFDLGGGTFDVSVLKLSDGLVEVVATHGDVNLGGEDWDSVVVDWITAQYLRRHGIDLSKSRQALQRIHQAAEEAKIVLSEREETEIDLPFIIADGNGPRHLHLTLTRETLEKLTAPLRERLVEPVRQVMRDAHLHPGEMDAVILVGGGTRMLCVQELVQDLTGSAPTTVVNPEEVVAHGAAVQAGVLAGEVEAVQLRDVTPLSLGVETMGGMMAVIIPRNTPIPAFRTEIFSTAEDNQSVVNIHVLQGERPMVADNKTLGVFRLEGLPPAPRGMLQIEVTFEIDANGILHVSALDRATGTCQAVTLSRCTRLADQEVEKVVEEAAACANEDEARRELLEARTVGEQVLYQTERVMELYRLSEVDCSHDEVAERLAALKEALPGDDANQIRELTAAVRQATMGWCRSIKQDTYQKDKWGRRRQHARPRSESRQNE
ncbi:MAG: molecular chaperone DnaK [Candidatus Promineifilaceae bacterium]|nr:molecular chaperone DnaK [Candidatus Promineifilaceae bacterium]